MSDREEQIRKRRRNEAIAANLMGPNGKIGTIVRFMGDPIIHQTSGSESFSTNDLGDFYNTDDMNEIPTAWSSYLDEPTEGGFNPNRQPIDEITTHTIGWHFDGLRHSMHMEITYNIGETELMLTWKGYTVYREVAGELTNFAPQSDWLANVDKLFNFAKDKERKQKKETREENKIEVARAKKSWLDKIKERWGV